MMHSVQLAEIISEGNFMLLNCLQFSLVFGKYYVFRFKYCILYSVQIIYYAYRLSMLQKICVHFLIQKIF
jgi:hypothetical protein